MSNVLIPYFHLVINGTELGEDYLSLVDTVTYEDNASGSDLLKIILSDPDLKVLSDSLFIEDVKVSFTGGWYRGDTTSFTGYISLIEADFPEDGTPTITINCMDKSYLMNKEKKQRTWEVVKVSEVAKQIFREYGFTPVVDDTLYLEDTITQNETDIQFLINLADEQPEQFNVYVEGNTGYFVRKDVTSNPQATLEYRQGNGKLLSFQPSINKYTKRVKVSASEVDQDTNTIYTSTVTDSVSRPTSGETYNPSTSDSSNSGGTWVYENGKWVKK